MLTVEDGSGKPDADSYRTTGQIAAYAAARGLTFPIAGAAAEQAARRAAEWLDGAFRSRFPGRKTNGRGQAREWPRTGAKDTSGEPIDAEEIPVEIGDAQCEAAVRELATPGALSPDYVPAERVKSETVGPISVTYADGAGGDDVRPVLTVVEDILSGLLRRESSTLVGMVARA